MNMGAAVAEEIKKKTGFDGVKPQRLSSTTVISNIIRRAGRSAEHGAGHQHQIARMVNDGKKPREIYQAGQAEGRQMAVDNLADVLFSVQYAGLGRASVVEESRSHIVFRIHDLEQGRGDLTEAHCDFVAGFIAGALQASERYEQLTVSRTENRTSSEQACLFRANLKIK